MKRKSHENKDLAMEWAPKNILESMDDGIAVIDTDLRIVYVNATHRREFGEVVDKFCYKVFADRNSVCSDCPVADSMAGGAPTLRQKVSFDSGGQRKIVEVKASPLKNVSGQVVGAIKIARNITERKLIEEEADRRGREIGALAEVAMALNKSIELEDVLKVAIEQAVEVCGAVGGSIRLLEKSGEQLVTRAWTSKTEDDMPEDLAAPQALDVGIIGKVAADKKIMFVSDIENQQGHENTPHGRALNYVGVRSIVIVPLLGKNKLLGTLSLGSLKKNHFRAESKGLLEAIANQVTISIENANLLEKAREDAGDD